MPEDIFSIIATRDAHTCSLKYDNQDKEPPKLWHDPVTGLSSKYKPFEATKMEAAFVKPTKAKSDSIKGIFYHIFDDIPQPIDKGYPEEKYFEPTNVTYTPFPFDARYLRANGEISIHVPKFIET